MGALNNFNSISSLYLLLLRRSSTSYINNRIVLMSVINVSLIARTKKNNFEVPLSSLINFIYLKQGDMSIIYLSQ
jgi:hypothetical protein